MKTFLVVLLVLALLATLGVLLMGVVGMVRGNDPRQSNKMMRARVLMQGIALAVLAVLLLLVKS